MTIVLEVRLISLSLYKCCKQMKCCSYDQEVTCQLLVIVSIHYYTVKYRYFNFNIARQVLLLVDCPVCPRNLCGEV